MKKKALNFPKLLLALLGMSASGLALLGFCRRGMEWMTAARNEVELLPLIRAAAARHDVPEELVRAVIWKESRFNSAAVGSKGEIGLMQITDGAVQDWARRRRQKKPVRRELFKPEVNLEIGTWYLAQCGRHWDGYLSRDILQLAEYNAGRRKVLKDWAPSRAADSLSLDAISYPGTQDYISQILARRAYYRKQLEKEREAHKNGF